MNEHLSRRLCLAADMEQYSRLDTRTQSVVQSDLVRLLDEAAALAGLDRAAWERQPQGDQELAVLPVTTPEVTVLGPFVHQLTARLGVLNARTGGPRVRLPLAVDRGVVADAALGHAGPAPVAVARYVNAPQLKAVLAAIRPADLAVIVSDRLYQDVVRSGYPDLDPAQYVRAHVRVKEFGGYGWIRVPGHAPDEVSPAVDGPDGSLPPAKDRLSGRPAPSQYVHQGVAVGRDVRGGLTVGLPVTPPQTGSGHVR
ncbi:hypothetical protein A8713_27650 [Streptomyces sp. SAT1]|uniref:hypothetical protein n=1 Tax=Streptomyces sp. SAT1 TaxID=1849967 RepID=UPI0007DD08C5|nr:hypothetical protein [Streptomyces sp. SAT1]ANH94491.1 hypothetical protein A8713_27650 [Streptomyces sp. SAT1]